MLHVSQFLQFYYQTIISVNLVNLNISHNSIMILEHTMNGVSVTEKVRLYLYAP